MHKSNKPSCLLTRKLHKAPRFVQFVYQQQVFAEPNTNLLGSCALIVIYKSGLSSFMMQVIAKQTNHPATVFLNQADIKKHRCPIRWFNHHSEIKRCGHGTLAAAKFLATWQGLSPKEFVSSSDEIFKVIKQKKVIKLKLNCIESSDMPAVLMLDQAITANIKHTFITAEHGGYTTIIIDDAQLLEMLWLDMNVLKNYANAVIVLQKRKLENIVQWYFRYFAPYYGVNEDAATGSALSVIAPIINNLTAVSTGTLVQCSPQGAIFNYTLEKSSVTLS